MSNTFTPRSFCPGKKTWVGPLIACTAALAPAQTIYRVVGPDGKVTFTDRPPGNAEAAQQQQTAKPAHTPAASPPPASETRPMPQPAASATEPATAKKANAAKSTPADRPASVVCPSNLGRLCMAYTDTTAPPTSTAAPIRRRRARVRSASTVTGSWGGAVRRRVSGAGVFLRWRKENRPIWFSRLAALLGW